MIMKVTYTTRYVPTKAQALAWMPLCNIPTGLVPLDGVTPL